MIKRNPLGLYTLLILDEDNVGPHVVEYLATTPQCLRLLIYSVLSEVDKTGKLLFPLAMSIEVY